MKSVIDKYEHVVIQIATPYSTGTGFYLHQYNIIVTNEHVIRDNKQVIIDGKGLEKNLTRVLFVDQKHDLAFLEAPEGLEANIASLGLEYQVNIGDTILAIGHPFGLRYTATQGIISNLQYQRGDINYLQHDAALNPGNSGGPLINQQGQIVGVNTFVIQNGENIGFSLPIKYLYDTLEEYIPIAGQIAARCYSCENIVREEELETSYCPHCGAHLTLPTGAEEYEPMGVARTIEEMIEQNGHKAAISRRGPNNWEIQQGSARVNICYYEKNGLILGDAFLCTLPRQNIKPLYEYLLRQNHKIEGLTFSIKGQDVVLSLLIYDKYFNLDTGLKLFKHLSQIADDYDNILVEEYGADWKLE